MECFSGLFSKLQTIFYEWPNVQRLENHISQKYLRVTQSTTYVSPHYVNDDRKILISSKFFLAFLMHYFFLITSGL